MSPYGNFNFARQEFKKAALKALYRELRMRVKYGGLIAKDN